MEKEYSDLIGEAFIDPIRSVLIVDDDYPTFYEILLEKSERESQFPSKDWDRSAVERAKVRKVIEEFRRPEAPYLLDIHDGTSPSEATDERQVRQLHQTDLLILDYQLEKRREGDGTKALHIARRALANKHFNLILVHTQEDLTRVFNNFMISLTVPRFSNDQVEISESLQKFLNDHEDALVEQVGDSQYVAALPRANRKEKDVRAAIQKGAAPWGDVQVLFKEKGLDKTEWLPAVKHALQIFEENNKGRFSKDELSVNHWGEGDVKFIRAARGFVAFKSKDDGEELLPAVHRALEAWNPRPPRLMLTKLRAEMNERGIEAQDDALGEPDVGAIWYHRVLKAEMQNLDAIINGTVRNHADQLLDRLLPNVSAFAKKIRAADSQRDPIEAVKAHFNVDLSKHEVLTNAKMGHNAFVGSKPGRTLHLELGHILKVHENYWLCLTPACDMVPKRDRGHPSDRMKGMKRFTALMLVPQSPKVAIPNANRGGQIFANVTETPGHAERRSFSAAKELGASPAWMVMYVSNDGYLPDEVVPHVEISYVSKPKSVRTKKLQMKHAQATVCGMLRYEYALEIQSRFITSQSRIGLDFVSADDGDAGFDAVEA
ncbi:response regulator receiver domain [Rhizobium gallicum]|uniref:response regulator receiver domain n=1 Tax=Rhizobium gallicum TaxID=56730 RepID=UPI0003662BDE